MLTFRPFLLASAVLAATVLLGGCVPGTHVDASSVAGRVVDRATGQPIAGAKVVLSTFSPDHEAKTQTDANGRFHLAGFRHVEFTPLPYGVFRAPTGRLRVEADGYRPYGCGEFYDQNGKHPGYKRANPLPVTKIVCRRPRAERVLPPTPADSLE